MLKKDIPEFIAYSLAAIYDKFRGRISPPGESIITSCANLLQGREAVGLNDYFYA